MRTKWTCLMFYLTTKCFRKILNYKSIWHASLILPLRHVPCSSLGLVATLSIFLAFLLYLLMDFYLCIFHLSISVNKCLLGEVIYENFVLVCYRFLWVHFVGINIFVDCVVQKIHSGMNINWFIVSSSSKSVMIIVKMYPHAHYSQNFV